MFPWDTRLPSVHTAVPDRHREIQTLQKAQRSMPSTPTLRCTHLQRAAQTHSSLSITSWVYLAQFSRCSYSRIPAGSCSLDSNSVFAGLTTRALRAQPPPGTRPYQLLGGHELEELLDEVHEALDGPGPLHRPLLGPHDGGVAHGLQQHVNCGERPPRHSGTAPPPLIGPRRPPAPPIGRHACPSPCPPAPQRPPTPLLFFFASPAGSSVAGDPAGGGPGSAVPAAVPPSGASSPPSLRPPLCAAAGSGCSSGSAMMPLLRGRREVTPPEGRPLLRETFCPSWDAVLPVTWRARSVPCGASRPAGSGRAPPVTCCARSASTGPRAGPGWAAGGRERNTAQHSSSGDAGPRRRPTMIKAILIFNNHGKPRLSKFYQRYVRAGRGSAGRAGGRHTVAGPRGCTWGSPIRPGAAGCTGPGQRRGKGTVLRARTWEGFGERRSCVRWELLLGAPGWRREGGSLVQRHLGAPGCRG